MDLENSVCQSVGFYVISLTICRVSKMSVNPDTKANPPKPYILLGHMSESIVGERPRVPDGCMLVLAEECGVLGSIPERVFN